MKSKKKGSWFKSKKTRRVAKIAGYTGLALAGAAALGTVAATGGLTIPSLATVATGTTAAARLGSSLHTLYNLSRTYNPFRRRRRETIPPPQWIPPRPTHRPDLIREDEED